MQKVRNFCFRCFMLVELGRVLIKTGGGFMGIEEFLDLFAAVEIERMEK